MFDSGHVNLDEIAEVLDYSHRYGHYVSGLCPFHDDHKPSFFVYPDSYICLSCGAHGKSSTLLEKQNDVLNRPGHRFLQDPRQRIPTNELDLEGVGSAAVGESVRQGVEWAGAIEVVEIILGQALHEDLKLVVPELRLHVDARLRVADHEAKASIGGSTAKKAVL